MKNLKICASITAVLCFLAVFSIIFLFMSLSDIADSGTALHLEWYISGICLIILSAFTLSSIITLSLLLKHLNTSEIINLMTDYDMNSKSSHTLSTKEHK
ncbi:MAG TPA: hypothetical protein VHO68_14635 [Bacteroidales bacterium]|nr:hypothetical protein [Bacteroidales bacterium]